MAQQRLTGFMKDRQQTKTYVALVGHETLHLLHPELFAPRAKIMKDGKPSVSEKGYEKSYDIDFEDLPEKVVSAWTSKNTHYNELDSKNKTIINNIKKFLNREEWGCLVVFHSTECRINKQYTYGNHLHIIIQTTQQQLSRNTTYRTMQEGMNRIGGICTLREVRSDVMGFMKYLLDDEEKIFLGTNSNELREMYKRCLDMEEREEPDWELLDENDLAPEVVKRQLVPFMAEVKKPKTVEEQLEDTPVPLHLQKDKSPDAVNFVLSLLKKNRDVSDVNALVTKYGLCSEEGKALCNIATSSNGQKTFNLAMKQLQEDEDKKTLGERVKELDDVIPGYMDVVKSQAIFNAWCGEQTISPRKYAMTMQLLLGEQSYKKIGLYLQGRPNSGKTALTNNMWACMGQTVLGRITKETFCFQDCAGKKLIIGEEIALNEANVDRFKDLLSGGTLMCEIKNKAPGPCTPKIVLMNSNNEYTLNLSRQSGEQIKVRIYSYPGLKVTQALKQMTGHFHPRMFYDNIIPLQQEETINLIHNTGEWDMEPIGAGEFTGDWDDIHSVTDTNPKKRPADSENPECEEISSDDTSGTDVEDEDADLSRNKKGKKTTAGPSKAKRSKWRDERPPVEPSQDDEYAILALERKAARGKKLERQERLQKMADRIQKDQNDMTKYLTKTDENTVPSSLTIKGSKSPLQVKTLLESLDFKARKNYRGESDAKVTIYSVINECNLYYARRSDIHAGLWKFNILELPIDQTTYNYTGRRTLWIPQQTGWDKCTTQSRGDYFRADAPVWVDRDVMNKHVTVNHKTCHTELKLRDHYGWTEVVLIIPPIFRHHSYVAKVSITGTQRTGASPFHDYADSSADTIPTYPKPWASQRDIAHKCFDYMRIFLQVKTSGIRAYQMRNRDMVQVLSRLIQTVRRLRHSTHDIRELLDMRSVFGALDDMIDNEYGPSVDHPEHVV